MTQPSYSHHTQVNWNYKHMSMYGSCLEHYSNHNPLTTHTRTVVMISMKMLQKLSLFKTKMAHI